MYRNRSKLFLHLAVIIFVLLFSGGLSSALEWSDPALSTTNEIRARHILELRANVNNKRQECGMAPYLWQETAIIPKTTPVRASHITEIRTAIKQIANQPPARTAPTFSDSLFVGETAIRYDHIQEMRDAIENASCCGDAVCDTAEGENGTNCPGDCLCTYSVSVGATCGEGDCDESGILITKTAPEPGCPTLYSCEAKPSLCCTITYAYLGCGDGIHCGETQRMTERIGIGCEIPDSERYICGADETCCEFLTTDLGCGANFDGTQYPYYSHVYIAVDQLGVCEDKIAIVDNEAECCNYQHKQGCGDPTCGLGIYNKDLDVYQACPTADTCPVVPPSSNVYYTCDYSESFPIDCAPNRTAVEDSANCCNFVETFECINHTEEEEGIPVTRIATDKQVTRQDPTNPDCTVTVTVVEPPFHNDCCHYTTVTETCVPADATETVADEYTKRVRLTIPENAECPNQEDVLITDKTPDNPCCRYGDALPQCGGQCNNRGPVYPVSTYLTCQPADNLLCTDIVTGVEENSDQCCNYVLSEGCGLTCGGVTYGPNEYVKCNRPQIAGCPEVLAAPVQQNTDACCNFVIDEGCGLTCDTQNFDPGVRVSCQRSNVSGCPETILSQTAADETCCAYTQQSDCGLTCNSQTYPQSSLVTCRTSNVEGCPESLVGTPVENDDTCCQYTTYGPAQLGCGMPCGTETNLPGTRLDACIISQTGYCANTHTRTSPSAECCNYDGPITTCADPNLCCGITCGATTHNPNERVWCQTSEVLGCPEATETQPHVVDHADCCQMRLNPAGSTGCGATCDGTTYGPLDRVTRCYYSDSDRCDHLNDIDVTLNDTANCCVYALDPTKSGCGATCDGTTYQPYEQIECRTTPQAGCQAERATLISTGTDCCNYVTTSNYKAFLPWVTDLQAAYDYCLVTYRTSGVAGCSTPVFVSADCSAARRTAFCGFTSIYQGCGPYTCGVTAYQGSQYINCYQATQNTSYTVCDTYATVDASRTAQCCAYQDVSGCGTSPTMAFCLGGPYAGSTYLTCRSSNGASGCTASGTVIGTPVAQSTSCCNYTEETQCGLTCPPPPAVGGTPAEERFSVYCKWDPNMPACAVTRTATPSDACCDYTSTTQCGLTCNGETHPDGDLVTCYSSAVPGCTKPATVVSAAANCCDFQTVEGCGLVCAGTDYDDSQWVSCRTSSVDGCPASTLNALPIEDDPRCCSYSTPVSCGGTCEGQPYDESFELSCRISAVDGCPASTLVSAIDDDPDCCNFSEATTCGGTCESQTYTAAQLITCKTSSVNGCPQSTLTYGPESNTQSCCQWDTWTTTPNGGCGATLPPELQARVFAGNPVSCPVTHRLEIRYPISNGCNIYTQCIDDDTCADCVYNASDALNDKRACSLGSTCTGIQRCQPGNIWGSCEYTVCTPGSKIRCDYLETTALDPYAKLDYKICNSCGTGWSECSCGQYSGLPPWDQVNCYSAYPPCYTNPSYPVPCPELTNNCPGLRVCTSNEWEATCNWRETYCYPGDSVGSCYINTPNNVQKAGKTVCNSCGTDVVKVNNTAKCYCIADAVGCDTGVSGCDYSDGVYKCNASTGQFAATCEINTNGPDRCVPGDTATCISWVGHTRTIDCTDCGVWDKPCKWFETFSN